MERATATVYVANLPWETTEDDLEALFAPHVRVLGVRVIQDPVTGRSRGYGFVELDGAESLTLAVACLNGCEFRGRRLLVSEARPRRRPI